MPNQLAQSASLYLRKHAHNPIDWWPWSAAALEKAAAENKPIFLSIGYSSCHWCTVMEGEAFSDPDVADYLNQNFVAIKVDREERPDLDSIYMQALQLMIGQGGWPLNLWLDPRDRLPFFGGTYFPIEARQGRPGFLALLQALRQHYDQEPAKVAAVKDQLLEHLQASTAITIESETDDLRLDPGWVEAGWQEVSQVLLDHRGGTRFPMMPYAEFGLQAIAPNRASIAPIPDNLELDPEESDPNQPPPIEPRPVLPEAQVPLWQALIQRGTALALGGIFDHVAGGFHRYTVDPTWTVPHFEKMLYDNGQILRFLADLWSAGERSSAIRRAIDLTVTWLQREMTSPEGAFYAAQDADSFPAATAQEPEEGAFYVWSWPELSALLEPEDLADLAEHFTITVGGNFEGTNVLQRRKTSKLSDRTEATLDRLFALRYGGPAAEVEIFEPARSAEAARTTAWPGRIPPVTDTKIIVAWNGLAIAGLARAAAVLGEPDYYELAAQAARFIRNHQWQNGRLHRLNYPTIAPTIDRDPTNPAEQSPANVAVLAQSEDFAEYIRGVLALEQAAIALNRPDEADDWLALAIQVQAEFDSHLWNETSGGYDNAPHDASQDLLIRERSYIDNATPAANGTALGNLVQLFLLTGQVNYLDRAAIGLQSFQSILADHPRACPSLLAALDRWQRPILVKTTAAIAAQLAQTHLPTVMIALDDDGELPIDAIAIVCVGTTCLEPAQSIDQLWSQLRRSSLTPTSPGV